MVYYYQEVYDIIDLYHQHTALDIITLFLGLLSLFPPNL